MPRTKSGIVSHRRAKKLLKSVKGYRGGKSKLYKTAHEARMRALAYAYRDRKQRKRDFRGLWIVRLNAAVREYGISYSKFINSLKKAGIIINRKALANLALYSKETFKKLVDLIKTNA